MVRPILLQPKPGEFFCQTYWRSIFAQDSKIPDTDRFRYRVNKYNVFAANQALHGVEEDISLEPKKLQKIISRTDKEIRSYSPTVLGKTLWRGITTPEFHSSPPQFTVRLYENCFKLKEGDIIYMKEFPFMSSIKKTAQNYSISPGKENLLYNITIPDGMHILRKGNMYILPRYSKFVCTGSQRFTENNRVFKQINLKLLPRDINTFKKKNIPQKLFGLLNKCKKSLKSIIH